MGPVIIIFSLALAAQPESQGASPPPPTAQGESPVHPPGRRPQGRVTSPPGAKPTPPSTNIDPGIQLPTDKTPESPSTPSESGKPTTESVKPKDDSVKPVPPAPSEPGKPGVRPL